jgi:hypothetical protein
LIGLTVAELTKARHETRRHGAGGHHHPRHAKRRQSNDQANQIDANADLTFC